MILALLLDTDHAFSILNMGPSADSKEVGRNGEERTLLFVFNRKRIILFG